MLFGNEIIFVLNFILKKILHIISFRENIFSEKFIEVSKQVLETAFCTFNGSAYIYLATRNIGFMKLEITPDHKSPDFWKVYIVCVTILNSYQDFGIGSWYKLLTKILKHCTR